MFGFVEGLLHAIFGHNWSPWTSGVGYQWRICLWPGCESEQRRKPREPKIEWVGE